MNWEKEIEIPAGNGNNVCLTVAEIVSNLMADLTKDEMEAVGSELIKAAVMEPIELGD